MNAVLSILVTAAVTLGGAFGQASATASPIGVDQIRVEFTVDVAGAANAVVAHLIDVGGDQQTLGLGPDGNGRWGGFVDIPPKNLIVVFEAIRADGTSDMSKPVTLATLGVDPEALGMVSNGASSSTEEGYSKLTIGWGWLALALTAAALSLLAFWALGGRVEKGSGKVEGEGVEASRERTVEDGEGDVAGVTEPSAGDAPGESGGS